MDKHIYNRYVAEYSKESKEELIQRILALDEIECEDRSFANECKAGTSIYNINQLFSVLENMQTGISDSDIQKAKESWNYIKDGLLKINDTERCSKTLSDFRKKVKMAADDMDLI